MSRDFTLLYAIWTCAATGWFGRQARYEGIISLAVVVWLISDFFASTIYPGKRP